MEDGLLNHLLDGKAITAVRQIDEGKVCLNEPSELCFYCITNFHGDLYHGNFGTQRTYTTLY